MTVLWVVLAVCAAFVVAALILGCIVEDLEAGALCALVVLMIEGVVALVVVLLGVAVGLWCAIAVAPGFAVQLTVELAFGRQLGLVPATFAAWGYVALFLVTAAGLRGVVKAIRGA